ncbi:right-handed parallel beta-helix repeat-containing protein [Actinoplanes solisilvae]|uniref:right-handed parallel beta-helix repeat-containing protein n=1 Tax=Actinoplanes solisilvae TaxID=2486853 RepID=UPI000FDB19EB|nr:right-handed parallel beta-helix repeat-containing protein [Actinoplanes solisilvae]
MGAGRRNFLRAGVVGGGAALLSQFGAGAARAAGINPFPPGEDEPTRELRTALDNAANNIGDERDDCGRIVVKIDPDATIRLRNTLIIGPNTCLDATEATILAAFPTAPQTYTAQASGHSPTPVYPTTFTSVKAAGVSHATMVLNHVPADARGFHQAPGNIRIQGGFWDPTASYLENVSADDRAKATQAPPLNVITMQHTSNIEIEGVTVRDVKWWHAVELNAVRTATISGCAFEGWVEDPTVGLWHGEAVQLDLAASNTTWAGDADGTPCSNIRIAGNRCGTSTTRPGWGRFMGSHTSQADAIHSDVTVEFNIITSTKYDAIGPLDTRAVSVRGNTITNCVGGVYVKTTLNNVSRVDVVDNVVTGTTRAAIAVRSDPTTFTLSDVAVFANNVNGTFSYAGVLPRAGHSPLQTQ